VLLMNAFARHEARGMYTDAANHWYSLAFFNNKI
jgi:hypothetical protein